MTWDMKRLVNLHIFSLFYFPYSSRTKIELFIIRTWMREQERKFNNTGSVTEKTPRDKFSSQLMIIIRSSVSHIRVTFYQHLCGPSFPLLFLKIKLSSKKTEINNLSSSWWMTQRKNRQNVMLFKSLWIKSCIKCLQ